MRKQSHFCLWVYSCQFVHVSAALGMVSWLKVCIPIHLLLSISHQYYNISIFYINILLKSHQSFHCIKIYSNNELSLITVWSFCFVSSHFRFILMWMKGVMGEVILCNYSFHFHQFNPFSPISGPVININLCGHQPTDQLISHSLWHGGTAYSHVTFSLCFTALRSSVKTQWAQEKQKSQTVFAGGNIKGVIWCFLKIIILCIRCNRICWHALMFKNTLFFKYCTLL